MSNSVRLPTLSEQWFPSEDEPTLECYLQRLGAAKGMSRFGIMIDSAHGYHPEIWKRSREILGNLYRFLPMPITDINTDVFIGNYPQTPFGVHLDKLHNLMFMVEGKRTMRLWPYETGLALFGEPDSLVRDYKHALDSSIVFELEAGDMLYWPDDYWHVGENSDVPSVSMNIDYMQEPDKSWESNALANAFEKQNNAAVSRLPAQNEKSFFRTFSPESEAKEPLKNTLAMTRNNFRSLFEGKSIDYVFYEKWMERLSAYGMRSHIPLRKKVSLVSEDYIRADVEFPLLLLEVDDRLYIGCNGKVVVKRVNRKWASLVELLNTGKSMQISSLPKLLQHAAPAASSLTLETIIVFLEDLYQYRGIERQRIG